MIEGLSIFDVAQLMVMTVFFLYLMEK